MPNLANYQIPEADEGNEHAEALYDSERDYLAQLAAYKAFQGKSHEDVA